MKIKESNKNMKRNLATKPNPTGGVSQNNNYGSKAVIFARVSTKEQDIHSLEAQINKALEYSIENGFQIIKQFKIIESSTKGKRP